MEKAIAYFTNGLGNFILMMPALQAAASLTKTHQIDLCLSDQWKDGRRPAVEEIAKKWEVTDRVISYPSGKLDPRHYDLWFYSPHGHDCDVKNIFLQRMTYPIVPKPSWRGSLKHEKDHYMDIAYAMGYQGSFPKVKFPLADGPILDSLHPIIALCNGAFNTTEWQKKHWPHYGELAKASKEYFGGTIVGVGGPNELKGVYLNQDFTGKLSITETAKVLSQCDLLIVTDTGLMHLGWMLDLPLIAIFGPTLTSKNAPQNKNSSILISGLNCAPCQDTGRFHNCKDRDYTCMKTISVGDVMTEMRRKLK